jgi:hypothetical protein
MLSEREANALFTYYGWERAPYSMLYRPAAAARAFLARL